jgi:hypothetical protein
MSRRSRISRRRTSAGTYHRAKSQSMTSRISRPSSKASSAISSLMYQDRGQFVHLGSVDGPLQGDAHSLSRGTHVPLNQVERPRPGGIGLSTGEGLGLDGWAGEVIGAGNRPHLPDGRSVCKVRTRSDVRVRDQEDYAEPAGFPDASSTTYVAVTAQPSRLGRREEDGGRTEDEAIAIAVAALRSDPVAAVNAATAWIVTSRDAWTHSDSEMVGGRT